MDIYLDCIEKLLIINHSTLNVSRTWISFFCLGLMNFRVGDFSSSSPSIQTEIENWNAIQWLIPVFITGGVMFRLD